MTEAVASGFETAHPNVQIAVGVSGTGGGFKRFTRGELDVCGASRPIKLEEFVECVRNNIEFLELPVAFDGLTIVVHTENDWVEKLTLDQLRAIFLEDPAASRWSDVDPSWPDEPIKIFAPGTDSGTFDYFREVMVGQDASRAIRTDMSTNEDDNVLVTGVKGEKYAIGFFGAAYYYENRDVLRAVPIVNPATGEAHLPVPEAIKSGQYAPFSRPLFVYVRAESVRRPEVKAFLDYYLENASTMAARVNYVPLDEGMYERVREHYSRRITGTHFLAEDGEVRSGSLAELYLADPESVLELSEFIGTLSRS